MTPPITPEMSARIAAVAIDGEALGLIAAEAVERATSARDAVRRITAALTLWDPRSTNPRARANVHAAVGTLARKLRASCIDVTPAALDVAYGALLAGLEQALWRAVELHLRIDSLAALRVIESAKARAWGPESNHQLHGLRSAIDPTWGATLDAALPGEGPPATARAQSGPQAQRHAWGEAPGSLARVMAGEPEPGHDPAGASAGALRLDERLQLVRAEAHRAVARGGLNRTEARRRHVGLPEEEDEIRARFGRVEVDPAAEVEARDLGRAAMEALAALPPRERAAVEARAEGAGVGDKRSRAILVRALRKLRARLPCR